MLNLKQLQYESDTWKRTLAFMLEENIHLKNRLSEVLKESNADLVDVVEGFHDRFLRQDMLVVLMKRDIADFDKLLTRELFEDGMIKKKVETLVRTIRNNMDVAVKQFDHIGKEFNNYLLENM